MDKGSGLQTGTRRSERQHLSESPVWQAPPALWDNLSKISVTKRALKELNRRDKEIGGNSLYSRTRPPLSREFPTVWKRDHCSASDILGSCTAKALRDIGQLARHGGPDNSDLRGYPEPIHPLDRTMSPTGPSFRGRPRGSKSTSGTKRTTNTTKTKKTTPYDREFEQNLIDGGVFPDCYRFPDGRDPPEPDNWDEMNQRITQYRASLSSSNFSDGAHKKFRMTNAAATKEHKVIKSVISVIEGEIRDEKCVSGEIPFRNLVHLTDGTIVPGNPDLYDGARPEQLNKRVREDLSDKIQPSTQASLPIAPNFFLAIKGPDGTPAVARLQALYDAALGERGQLTLESWGQDGIVFDHKAHTITSTYLDGHLTIYSVYAAQSNGNDCRPEYYMHQIKAYAMKSDADAFRKGATAFRNLRDYAEEQRNGAIQRANERAQRIDDDGLDDEDDEELQNGSLPATFGLACATRISVAGGPIDE